MTILEQAKGLEAERIRQRRWFHRHPDMTGEEAETLAAIRRELDALGAEYTEVADGGILGAIEGGRAGGRSVLLRADIDGLLDHRPRQRKDPAGAAVQHGSSGAVRGA